MPQMLQTAKVGRPPVDLAARFALDGSRITIENLGTESIRFAPAAVAGEAAPADLRAGFLLEPGKRETFRPSGGAAFPLWAWGGGEVGIGPAIGPETGGGGGLSLVFAGGAVETALSSAPARGATLLNVVDASVLRRGRGHVAGEVITIEAIDETANTVTLEAGLRSRQHVAGVQVGQAPLVGADDVLALPAGPYAELDVRLLYDLPQTGGSTLYSGRSSGAFYSDGAMRSSWVETLSNFNYWFAFGNTDPSLATFSVGLVHGTGDLNSNAWTVEFDRSTYELSFLPADPNQAVAFLPRARELIVAGRRA